MESKTENKTKKRISKKEILFTALFSVFFVFFFFIFRQVDLLKNNQVEFNILFSEVIGSYILITLAILVCIFALLVLICYFFKRTFQYLIATLTGFSIACYIQMLLLNRFVTITITGHLLHTSIFSYIVNGILFIAVSILPVIILNRYRKKHPIKTDDGETKEKQPSSPTIFKALSACLAVILGMQMIGLFSAGSYEQPAKDNELYYFSIDDQLKLSKNENIVVFVLDRMDTDYVTKVFEQYPESKEIFSGFNFYTDNISQYPSTFPSITSLLTGEVFDEEQTQVQFMEKAWEDPVLFNALRDNNYKINGLLNSIATFYDYQQVVDKFDNMKKLDSADREIKLGTLYRLSLVGALNQYMPYALKGVFQGYIDIPNKCVEIKNTPDYYNKTACAESDLRFYERLTNENVGLSANEEQNVFSFVHFLGSHSPYDYNAELELESSNEISQTRGTYKILDEYFTQMKNLGIYQNSTIIVMADHGKLHSTFTKSTDMTDAPMAGLFIKKSGSGSNIIGDTSSQLVIDETSQLSNSNFIPSVVEILYEQNNSDTNLAYLNQVKTNNFSYFDIEKPVSEGGQGGVQTRYYYVVSWTNLNSTKFNAVFIVNGTASDMDNWVKVEEE